MASQPLPPVYINNRFFYLDDKRFLIRGIVYQLPKARDPLTDDTLGQLERDIPLFKKLRINTILVYSVDDSKSHHRAMQVLSDAGIYVILGLSSPACAINRLSPLASYTKTLLGHCFRITNEFSQYTNTLCLLAGTDVINKPENTGAAEVIRAVVRDVKRYMRINFGINGFRVLPVGYSAADAPHLLLDSTEYFTAGIEEERIDFLAFSFYEPWNPSDNQGSGWLRLAEIFKDAMVPIFISGYGGRITSATNRKFEETSVLYSEPMISVFSGGCAYEYCWKSNNYGLVRIQEDGNPVELEEFQHYKEMLGLALENIYKNEDRPTEPVSWIGSFPSRVDHWRAGPNIPGAPVDWNEVRSSVEAETQP